MFKFTNTENTSKLPKSPGVYALKKARKILYIGKAANLRERVKNHLPERSEGQRRTNVLRPQQPGFRDNLFINQANKIGYIKTNSEIEALILEANLIKKYQPKYNVVWRDDKNYFFVTITKEDFPQIFITHQPVSKFKIDYVGPFVDGKALKQTLKILRKVFPYRSCQTLPKRPCLWYHLGRCLAPCLTKSTKIPVLHSNGKNAKFENFLYQKIKKVGQENVKSLINILRGKKTQVLRDLKREMEKASSIQDFEKAAKIRDQIEATERIISHARIFDPAENLLIQSWQMNKFKWGSIEKIFKRILNIKKKISRIEAYDVSNIQGKLATGSMVTFLNGQPDKNFYRRFKIQISGRPNDIAMIKEILTRRFRHPEWPYPDLILIDGGIGQLKAALKVKRQKAKGKSIKIISLAKKENKLYIESQRNPILLKNFPREISNLILRLRDEAHRFAITYHRKLREEF